MNFETLPLEAFFEHRKQQKQKGRNPWRISISSTMGLPMKVGRRAIVPDEEGYGGVLKSCMRDERVASLSILDRRNRMSHEESR